MKKSYLLSLAFAMMAIVIILSPSAYADMLTNQGFESGNTDGWGHWCINSAVTDTEKHSGIYSVELGLPAEYDKGALIQEVSKRFSAGKPIYAGAWVKTEDLEADAFLKLEFWNENGNEITFVEGKKITGTNKWTKITVSAVSVPANTAMIKVLLQLDGSVKKAKGGKVYLDDVYLDIIPQERPL